MKVFVVIATYNGKKWIQSCLNSILDSSIPVTTILVDNASNDGTLQVIKTIFKKPLQLKKLIILEQKENFGFGKANNIGISYALLKEADFTFLLNQDAYLQKETIGELIKVYKKNKDYGIISPMHLSGEGTKLDEKFSNYLKTNNTLALDVAQKKFSKTIYQVPFVNAAAWLLPKNTLKEIGGFDPIFSHYGEDNNYCQRLLYHKLKIGIVPHVHIRHDREFIVETKKRSNKENLIFKERYYKYKWANINIEVANDIQKQKHKLQKHILKFFVKLQFKKAVRLKKELAMINSILPEILSSRKINSEKGKHYLFSQFF